MKLGEFVGYRKNHWWLEYSLLSKFYGAALHVEFTFPTPKQKQFSFGVTLFTLTLFFIEIAYLSDEEIPMQDYIRGN